MEAQTEHARFVRVKTGSRIQNDPLKFKQFISETKHAVSVSLFSHILVTKNVYINYFMGRSLKIFCFKIKNVTHSD